MKAVRLHKRLTHSQRRSPLPDDGKTLRKERLKTSLLYPRNEQPHYRPHSGRHGNDAALWQAPQAGMRSNQAVVGARKQWILAAIFATAGGEPQQEEPGAARTVGSFNGELLHWASEVGIIDDVINSPTTRQTRFGQDLILFSPLSRLPRRWSRPFSIDHSQHRSGSLRETALDRDSLQPCLGNSNGRSVQY